MYNLTQSRRLRGSAGEPIDVKLPSLAEKGGNLVRGQLLIIAAAPGCGKSMFALTLSHRSRVPTLYFSADSDAFTQVVRASAMVSGNRVEDVARVVLSDDPGRYDEMLDGWPIRFNFDASPTYDTMELSLQSYEEIYGDFPSIVIVDNITNVITSEDSDPFAGLEAFNDYLHGMARGTGAAVIGLHHVTGPFNDARTPVPLNGVKGQIARTPEAVWTLHRPDDDHLGVSVPKNRGGISDPSGEDYAELYFDGSRAQIRDPLLGS